MNDVADKVKMRKGIDEIRVYNECAGFTVPVKRAFRQETDVTSSTLNTRIAPYWLATSLHVRKLAGRAQGGRDESP